MHEKELPLCWSHSDQCVCRRPAQQDVSQQQADAADQPVMQPPSPKRQKAEQVSVGKDLATNFEPQHPATHIHSDSYQYEWTFSQAPYSESLPSQDTYRDDAAIACGATQLDVDFVSTGLQAQCTCRSLLTGDYWTCTSFDEDGWDCVSPSISSATLSPRSGASAYNDTMNAFQLDIPGIDALEGRPYQLFSELTTYVSDPAICLNPFGFTDS